MKVVAVAAAVLVLAGAASAQAPRRTIDWPAVSACIKRLYAQRSADWVIALRCDPRRSEFAVKPRVVAAVEPSGFREARALEPAASWVAGKPVRVWCATSSSGWLRAAASATRDGDAAETLGYARVGADASYLAPTVCHDLSRVPLRVADAYAYSISLHALIHESEHLSGVADEDMADCRAAEVVSAVAIKFMGVRAHRLLRVIAANAWDSIGRTPTTAC